MGAILVEPGGKIYGFNFNRMPYPVNYFINKNSVSGL
jgi:hypothetical protein